MKRGSSQGADGEGSLGQARRAFERWRKGHAGGRRIPARLWRAAVEAARGHGVSKTSRALGLDYRALKERVGSSAKSGTGFAELRLSALAAPPECVLELEDGHGGRLRVELRGAGLASVEGLARGLWGAGR